MARLIDSSIIIAAERQGRSPADLVALGWGEPVAIASITVSELLFGLHRATSSHRRTRRELFIEEMLDHVSVLSFDLEIARVHAQIAAQLMATGQMIGANDLLIAASTVSQGYTLLTHDLRHFQRVPNLLIQQVNW